MFLKYLISPPWLIWLDFGCSTHVLVSSWWPGMGRVSAEGRVELERMVAWGKEGI